MGLLDNILGLDPQAEPVDTSVSLPSLSPQAKKQNLLLSLLGSSANLLSQRPNTQMGAGQAIGNLLGGATQNYLGMNDLGLRQANEYQKRQSENELHKAQTDYYKSQANAKEQLVTVQGPMGTPIQVPASVAYHFMPKELDPTKMKALSDIQNEQNTRAANQALSIMQPGTFERNTAGMSPQDTELARQSLQESVIANDPKVMETWQKTQAEKVPNAMREFEMSSGMNPALRGTPEYEAKFNKFKTMASELYGNTRLQAAQIFVGGRAKDLYDTQAGYVRPVTQDEWASAPQGRFTSSSDPMVGSLKNQEKQFGMMGGFVKNIDEQANKIENIYNKLYRETGIRGFDMPLRELKTRFIGTGQEKVLESYVSEISREIGKLAQGSQASVQQLTDAEREKWDKIHDVNLSWSELKPIINATKEQAYLRYNTAWKAIQDTKQRLQGNNAEPPPPAGVPTLPPYAPQGQVAPSLSKGVTTLRTKDGKIRTFDASGKEIK